MFNEKESEYSAKHGKSLPVWQSPKYIEARDKAIEVINSKKYGLTEADFWILMNTTKNDQMAYTGLIISHNGCLKINDTLESKFKPECVTYDTNGYGSSLVFHYCCAEQGIYEVGEVNAKNCRNDYPYAMAFKRCFDRVVLKLCKLAYAGIYSDAEADEFSQQLEPKEKSKSEIKFDEKNEKLIEDKIATLVSLGGNESKARKSLEKEEDKLTALDEWIALARKKQKETEGEQEPKPFTRVE